MLPNYLNWPDYVGRIASQPNSITIYKDNSAYFAKGSGLAKRHPIKQYIQLVTPRDFSSSALNGMPSLIPGTLIYTHVR